MTTEEKFLAAVNVIESLPRNGPFQPSEDMMLKFSSYHQQAIKGPCTSEKPSFFDRKRKEWYAWKSLGNMPTELAMEKYIEQLSKVIETMSYTEAVSKFIDLMGPFYEIVWPDDDVSDEGSTVTTECRIPGDQNEAQNNPIESENFASMEKSREIIISTRTISEESFEIFPSGPVQMGTFEKTDCSANNTSQENVLVLVDAPRSGLAVKSFIDVGDAKTKSVGNDDLIAFPASMPLPVNEAFSHDVLAASVLSLQKSLNDITEHLDSLEALANKYKKEIELMKQEDSKSSWWPLSPFTIAVLVLWPFVVHWVVHCVRQRRTT